MVTLNGLRSIFRGRPSLLQVYYDKLDASMPLYNFLKKAGL